MGSLLRESFKAVEEQGRHWFVMRDRWMDGSN
jgi:hypothetical protein